MSYSPINAAMYLAAFSGALSGMSASIRIPTSRSQLTYIDVAAIAGAWAQSFDINWNNAATPTELEASLAKELSSQTWITRAPNTIISAAAVTPSNYDPQTEALIAIILAGDSYVNAQGIPVPTPGGIYIPSLAMFASELDVAGNAVSIAQASSTEAVIHVPGLAVTVNGTLLGSGFIGLVFDGTIVSGSEASNVATLTFSAVPPSRAINTINGLSGGGTLVADLTLSWDGLAVQNGGVAVGSFRTVNWSTGLTASNVGGIATVTWNGLAVQSSGAAVATQTTLNIINTGGSVANNAGANRVDVTIPDLLSGSTQTWNTSGAGPQMTTAQATTTTNNATATLLTLALPDNKTSIVTVQVKAKAATGTASGAVYSIQQSYLRDSGGAPVALGSNILTSVGSASGSPPTNWTAIITASGNNAIVQVSSPAGVVVTWDVIAQEIL